MTSTFSVSVSFVTGLSRESRSRSWTLFFSPVYAGSSPNPTAKWYLPMVRSSWAEAVPGTTRSSANAAAIAAAEATSRLLKVPPRGLGRVRAKRTGGPGWAAGAREVRPEEDREPRRRRGGREPGWSPGEGERPTPAGAGGSEREQGPRRSVRPTGRTTAAPGPRRPRR